MQKNELIPLSSVPAGKTIKMVSVDAGQGLKSRLPAMGLLTNVNFKVIDNQHPGPFVLSLKGSKIALGRGMAAKIMVKEI